VRREGAAGFADLARDLDDRRRLDAALLGRLGRSREGVVLFERFDEAFEADGLARIDVGQVLAPVDPVLEEIAVVEFLGQDHVRHRQQQQGLGARPRRHPVVGHRSRVRQADVDHGQLRARHLRVHDPLGVRIEVVAGLEVRREQQHELAVGVVRRGPIGAGPQRIAQPRRRAADVGVRVVAVDAPALQHAVHVAVMTGRPTWYMTSVRRSSTIAARILSRTRRALRPRSCARTCRCRAADALHRVEDAPGSLT